MIIAGKTHFYKITKDLLTESVYFAHIYNSKCEKAESYFSRLKTCVKKSLTNISRTKNKRIFAGKNFHKSDKKPRNPRN